MKIYKMNEYDWVAAETLDEAKQALADTVNDGKIGPEFEDEFIENPYEVSEEELNILKLVDDDEINGAIEDKPDDQEGDWKKRYDQVRENSPTFKQALQKMIDDGETFPAHFASSDC
jgi:hypothetical protein